MGRRTGHWVGGWVDGGLVTGWMGGWVGGQLSGSMEGWKSRSLGGWVDELRLPEAGGPQEVHPHGDGDSGIIGTKWPLGLW